MKITVGNKWLFLIILVTGCTYKEIPPVPVVVDCSQSTLALSLASKQDASNCFLIDGYFVVSATGGVSPYVYSYNGGSFQASDSLKNLGPGFYLVKVRDANQCERSLSVEIQAAGSDLSVSIQVIGDSECLSDNGSIILAAFGGTAPYTFQFGTDTPDVASSYHNLKSGYYYILLRDSLKCMKTINVFVPRDSTGTSYALVVAPILNTNCAISGCHNGDNGESRDWTVFANVQKNAKNIKTRTQNRTMPLTGSLTQDEIDLIACWVDDGAENN